jgi:ribose/xylose/arabinose/galactoside ABC-type transport system permease subunit
VTGLNLIIPPYVLVFFLVALLAGILLKFTKYGRRIYAVGNNPNAAFLAGIDVRMMRLSVYTIMGFLVGIASVLLLARINVGIITLGQNLEIDTIAMVVIGGTALKGGKGNIVGTLIGVFFLGSIGNAMNLLRLPSEVQFVAKGIVIVVAVSAGHISSAISGLMSRRREARQVVQDAEAKG